MEQIITLETEAGQVSAELARRGVGRETKVLVNVLIRDPDGAEMAAIAEQGLAFAWLDSEPELYTDADLTERPA